MYTMYICKHLYTHINNNIRYSLYLAFSTYFVITIHKEIFVFDNSLMVTSLILILIMLYVNIILTIPHIRCSMIKHYFEFSPLDNLFYKYKLVYVLFSILVKV